LLQCQIRFNLCAKKIILVERLSYDSFKWVIGEIKYKLERARVHPGESVGSIAA